MGSLQMAKKGRHMFCLSLVCWTLLSSALSQSFQDLDSMCTNSRKGLPACNFNRGNCFSEGKDVEPAWRHLKEGEEGPVECYEKGCVFLDAAISKGKPRRMASEISANKKAICADFHYATTGSASVPISIYIENGKRYSLAHKIDANTTGSWKKETFSCCLPNVDESKWIAIEATGTAESTAAIDWVDIRLSDMPCENGDLVCYPGPPSRPPLEPITAPTCPAGQGDIDAALSCDFNAKIKTSPDFCEWEVQSGWEVRQKWDGTGTYDIIYATSESDATLLNTIADDVESVCIEIQFATHANEEEIRNVFSLNVITAGMSLPWGEAYNYKGSGESVWKRNSFDGFLPDAQNRKIEITSNTKGVKIDYIHIRKSDKPRTTDSPVDNSETWKTVFSCPPPSLLPLCGMTPDQVSKSRWSESADSQVVFPGKTNYILYSGMTKDLSQPASLTTSFIESNNQTTLTFSYALSGPVHLALYAEGEEQVSTYIWSTNQETNGAWVTSEVPISMTGKFRVKFGVVQRREYADEELPVQAGFADISLKVPAEPTPEPTTTSTTEAAPEPTTTPTTEAATEPTTTPTTEAAPEPATTPTTEAAPEPTPGHEPTSTRVTEQDVEATTIRDGSEERAPNTDTEPSGSGSTKPTGLIVGSIFGGLLAVTLIGVLVGWLYFRRRRSLTLPGRYLEITESTSEPQVFDNETYSP